VTVRAQGDRGKPGRRAPEAPVRPSLLPRARRRFGQHFLEPAWVARLIDAVSPTGDETFLEIGPGRGALTMPLSEKAGRVIAVEIDRDLAAALPAKLPPNVRVVQGDFLAIDFAALIGDERMPIRVVANLPYNVASPILFRLLREADDGRILLDATLMLQREVADRLLATPGSPHYGGLALQVGLLAEVDKVLSLPPGAFRPPPKVHSAVVRVRFRPPRVEVGSRAAYARVVRGLFLHRRKTLTNALRSMTEPFAKSAVEVLARAGLEGRRRPETLTIEEMARISRAVL